VAGTAWRQDPFGKATFFGKGLYIYLSAAISRASAEKKGFDDVRVTAKKRRGATARGLQAPKPATKAPTSTHDIKKHTVQIQWTDDR
jgi:hypothetical protein